MVGMGVEISNMLAYKLGVIDARRLDNVTSYFPSTRAVHTAELIVTKVSLYKYFHFSSKYSTRQIIANSKGTNLDKG